MNNQQNIDKINKEITFPKDKEEKIENIVKHLKNKVSYWSTKRTIKSELIKSKYNMKDVPELIKIALENKGLKTLIQNEIVKYFEKKFFFE